MDEELPGRLSPYVRRPPRARLPGSPPRRRLRSRIRGFFLVRFLLALPDDLAEAAAALFEPFERAARLLGRLAHGPALAGGWDSEAGRLALALYGFHWTRWQTEAEGPHGTFAARQGELTVRPAWARGTPDRASYTAACMLRRVPRPRRRRARVDLSFADGSWLALRMNTRKDAARLRAALARGPARTAAGIRLPSACGFPGGGRGRRAGPG
ncbi:MULTISPECIES: hypothetical protein [unclassified Streptomyces]|uniref:hypothetical protein n=1 Tax=unclassified Streptomyces TaxID=2593676 RepID=UPI002259AC0B|nr:MULTISPECIES: hypothetical protein [unclassified Streptomyces]MCX4528651.1 hypothetical protein [Streptomyces sp. NBC_01551]MCX4540742.1 hypothetical protein [Streptomyces sp. NBC_01565]